MRHKISTVTIILTITSLLFTVGRYDSASACECAPSLTPLEELERSGAVFSGRVIAITKNPSIYDKEVEFDVDRSWKGPSSKTVTVFTGDPSAICGYDFQEDEKYLVYAHPTEGFLYTSGCFRTQPLANAQEDLNALGAEWKVYKANTDDHVFKIPYRTTQGEVKEILVDPDFSSFIAVMASHGVGTIEITVPRNLIDARFYGGGDDEFIVLVDGEEESYEEVNKSPCFRTLLISFPEGAEDIEVIAGGIPEIPSRTKILPVYVDAETDTREIKISGCTDLTLDDKEVFLEVEGVNPEGEIHQTISIVPNRDGSFSTSFFIPDADENYSVSYTVKATYADYTYTYVPEFPVNLMVIAAIGLTTVLVSMRLRSKISLR